MFWIEKHGSFAGVGQPGRKSMGSFPGVVCGSDRLRVWDAPTFAHCVPSHAVLANRKNLPV